MAQLTATDIADLVQGTLRDLGRMKFQQIAQNLQHYEVFSKLFKKNKVVFDDGIGIKKNLMTKLSNQAGHVGLMDTDDADIPDLMEALTVDWRHVQTKYAMIYQTDILMNRGKSLIFNVLKPRRADAMISLAEEIEQKAWSVPSSTDTINPNGIPYYIVTNATTGFNGGAPTGHTTVAGINPTTTPKWKNYTHQYTTVSKTDLIKPMRTAHRKCGWHSPVGIPDYSNSESGQKYRLYCKEATLADLEDIGEGQNENLGRDVAPVGGVRDIKHVDYTLTFRKHPIMWVPQLDDASFTAANNPVYMLDFSTLYPVCLKGDYLRESEPIMAPGQHNVFRVFVEMSYNFLCVDRRRNAVFDTA